MLLDRINEGNRDYEIKRAKKEEQREGPYLFEKYYGRGVKIGVIFYHFNSKRFINQFLSKINIFYLKLNLGLIKKIENKIYNSLIFFRVDYLASRI